MKRQSPQSKIRVLGFQSWISIVLAPILMLTSDVKSSVLWPIALFFAGMIGMSARHAILAQSKRIDDLECQLKSKNAEPIE